MVKVETCVDYPKGTAYVTFQPFISQPSAVVRTPHGTVECRNYVHESKGGVYTAFVNRPPEKGRSGQQAKIDAHKIFAIIVFMTNQLTLSMIIYYLLIYTLVYKEMRSDIRSTWGAVMRDLT